MNIMIPIIALTDYACDPKCPWRVGNVPHWSCRLFEIHLMGENERSHRCALCKMAGRECAPKMRKASDQIRTRGITRR